MKTYYKSTTWELYNKFKLLNCVKSQFVLLKLHLYQPFAIYQFDIKNLQICICKFDDLSVKCLNSKKY